MEPIIDGPALLMENEQQKLSAKKLLLNVGSEFTATIASKRE